MFTIQPTYSSFPGCYDDDDGCLHPKFTVYMTNLDTVKKALHIFNTQKKHLASRKNILLATKTQLITGKGK